MRGTVCLLLFAVFPLAAPAAAAATSLPYTALVTGDNVYVRSGPGMNYYPTDKLQKGDQVEVYRHDPGGWYAIRPPRNSFSWVSSRYVEKTGDGLGSAKDAPAVVRVGSRMSNIRDVIQVRLDPGEPVEILETFNAGGQTWYKIAPPAGEFRWMYGRYLKAIPADPGARQTVASPPSGAASQARPPRVATPRAGPPSIAATDPPPRSGPAKNAAPKGPLPEASSVAPPDPNRSSRPPVGPPARDGWQSRGGELRTGAPQDAPPAAAAATGAPRPWQADRPATAASESAAPTGQPLPRNSRQVATMGTIGDQISRLEHQLSLIVAEDPGTWHFDELRRVASGLLVDAGTATERARVRQVLDKIARFEEIQQRRVQMGLAPALVNRRPRPSSGPAPAAAANQPIAARPPRGNDWLRSTSELLFGTGGKTSPFDGMGTLRPVVSRRPETPRYALVDNRGQVVSFVTPGPGVNLQPYVGRKIGVRGNRGYIPELHRTNVMARRITALDAGMVR